MGGEGGSPGDARSGILVPLKLPMRRTFTPHPCSLRGVRRSLSRGPGPTGKLSPLPALRGPYAFFIPSHPPGLVYEVGVCSHMAGSLHTPLYSIPPRPAFGETRAGSLIWGNVCVVFVCGGKFLLAPVFFSLWGMCISVPPFPDR